VLKTLAATIFTMGIITLVFSESRVSLIFMTVVISGLLLFNHDYSVGWSYSRIVAAITAILGIIGFGFALALDPDMFGRVYTVTVREILSLKGPLRIEDPPRIQIYKFTTFLLADIQTYISGVGYHNFGIEFESFTGEAQKNPHNAFLKPLLETGVVGFSLFTLILVYPFKYGVNAINISTEESERSLATGLLWSYVGVLIFGTFQPVVGAPHIYLLSTLLFSVLVTNTD
jgi:O-antigen ligase